MEATVSGNSNRMSFWTKLVYGSGDLGTGMTAALRGFFLLIFFTDVAHLNPGMAGAIVLGNRVWDAVNDPVVGWLSDRTVTRWGRRRPWLLFGAVPFGLLYVALWYVPPLGPGGLFIYYFVILLLLDTAFTVINVPYSALTPELTYDSDERTSLTSYRASFAVTGILISSVSHPFIVGAFDNVRTGYLVSGSVWALTATITVLLVFLFIRERPQSLEERPARDRVPYHRQLRTALANRPYIYVMSLYLFTWLALQLAQVVFIYYVTYHMRIPGDYYRVFSVNLPPMAVIVLAVQGASLAFLLVWSRLAQWLEKRTVYKIGAILWLSVMLSLAFLTPDMRGLVLPLALLAGAGISIAYLIPLSMMADVIEVDEWNTGMRREGVFYGFMVVLQKFSSAIVFFVVGQTLAWTGYIAPSDAVAVPVQNELTLWAIRLFTGPLPTIVLAIGIFIAWRYPITRVSHAELVVRLDKRRAREEAAALGSPDLVPAEP